MTKKIVSILLVLSLSVSLFAGSSLAAGSSDYPTSGQLGNFTYFTFGGTGDAFISTGPVSSLSLFPGSSSGFFDFNTVGMVFASPVSSGIFEISTLPSNASGFAVVFVDMSAHTLHQDIITSVPYSYSIPSSTSFVGIAFIRSSGSIIYLDTSTVSFSSIVYSSTDCSYDPSLDQDILSGVEAIAQSFLDLETGPYTTTSGVSLNSNGVVTPTTIQQSTLEQLLSLIGASSTYSGLVLEQMNLNFGNYFEYYETSDSTSGTVTVVRNLPAYVNAVGGELTDGINKLQRDNVLLYQQGENIEDALYADKSDNQPWSVAQWLKDLYTSITSFFSSFWSPAETDLKSAAEAGMQAAADNGNAASGSQVDEVNSAADAFKEFGSTGNIGSGDVMGIFSDAASYDFFSQTTKDNLAYHPPAGGQRMLRSSSAPLQSDQSEEEYVDELDDKLSYWREVLGLP